MNSPTPCPTLDTLYRFEELQLDPNSADLVCWIEQHVESCQSCQRQLDDQLALRQRDLAEILPDPISGYRVLSLLGRGGQACVYRALEISTERIVALKLIPKSSSNSDLIQAWRSEILVAAKMDHLNLVRLYSVQENPHAFLLVFEYIPGGTLQSQLDRLWTPQQIARLMVQVAQGLAKIHSIGFLHLDLKPSNILIDRDPKSHPEDWVAKISDFGISLTQPNHSVERDSSNPSNALGLQGIGTLEYMAPEQALGVREILTPSTDIYAFGRIMSQWLTRIEPGVHGRSASMIALREIAQCCTQIDPKKRYRSADEVIDQLSQWSNRYEDSVPNKSIKSIFGLTAALVCLFLVVLAVTPNALPKAKIASVAWESVAKQDLGEWIVQLDTPPEAITDLLSSKIRKTSEYWTNDCIDSGLVKEQPEQAIRYAILQRSAAERISVKINTRQMPLARDLLANATLLLLELRHHQPENPTVLKELIATYYASGLVRYHTDDIPRYDEYFKGRLGSLQQICSLIDQVDDPIQQIFWSTRVLDELRTSRRTTAWGAQIASLDSVLRIETDCKEKLRQIQSNNSKLQVPDLTIRLLLADSLRVPASVFEQLQAPSTKDQAWIFPDDAAKLLRECIATELGIPVFENSRGLSVPYDGIIEHVCSQAADGFPGDTLVPKVFQEDLFRFVASISTHHRLTGQIDLAKKIQSRYLGLCEALMKRFPDQQCLYLARSEAHLQAWKNALRQDDDITAIEALKKSYEESQKALELAPDSLLAHHQVSDRLKRIARFQSQSSSQSSNQKTRAMPL